MTSSSSTWTENTEKAVIYACRIMDHHIHISMLSSTSILTTISFLLISTLPQSNCQRPPQPGYNYSICREQSYNCGELSDISYPFWGQSRPAYCGGGKLFNLNCDHGHNTTTIVIGSQHFTVMDINTTTHTMRMTRADLDLDVCSPEFNDTYLSPGLFRYDPSVYNITIFYNCPSKDTSYFSCGPQNAAAICHVGAEDQLLLEFPEFKRCGRHIQVPAGFPLEPPDYYYGSGVIDLDLLKRVLHEGFQVSYNVKEECVKCLGREGDCWSSTDIDKQVQQSCYYDYCPDGSIATQCSDRKSKVNWDRKVIIGVICAVLGALAMISGFYFFKRRKKNGYAMSYIQSRSLSSDPSSKDPEKGSQHLRLSQNYGVHVFTYSELEEATNYFDSSRELGEGGFGTVYFGKLLDGRCVAVKRLYENNYRRVEQFMNEVKILAGLVHPNLVTLYGCTSRHSRELLLVYEYVPNGTVADHLHGKQAKPGTLPWHIRMNIAEETASALKYLHVYSIIHRDIKTNNILLDNHFRVKVADFGLSRLFPNHLTHVSTAPQGTPGYVDPEYHECYQLTDKSDVYSFGVVLIELISSLPAVDITRHRHEINLANMAINKIQSQALHELVDPSLGFESDGKVRKMINAVAELAFQCLQSSKDMRPSMDEVLDTLKYIKSDGKYKKSQPEVMDISGSADDVVLLKDDPPPPSPDSNVVSKSTTPNASG